MRYPRAQPLSMTPKEAVDLPLPWPVLTMRRGLSLFDLLLSRCSLGSLVSRVSLTPPFSSRQARPATRPAVPRVASTAPPSPLPALPPSRAGGTLLRCRPRTRPLRAIAVSPLPSADQAPPSPSRRSAGPAGADAPCRAGPPSSAPRPPSLIQPQWEYVLRSEALPGAGRPAPRSTWVAGGFGLPLGGRRSGRPCRGAGKRR